MSKSNMGKQTCHKGASEKIPNKFIYKHSYSRKNVQELVKKHCSYIITSIQPTDQFPLFSFVI